MKLEMTTPIYKYLSVNSLLSLIENGCLIMNQVISWPDKFEAGRYSTISVARGQKPELEQLYGSSWCLECENRSDYDSDENHKKGSDEITEFGSASMWEAYCQGGGVRIKTTIGKVLDIFKDYSKLCHGKIYYEPAWKIGSMTSDIENHLLHKRVCFRHENEYRFIVKSTGPVKSNQICFSDFLDEILVSPSVKSSAWTSRAIYKYVTNQRFSVNSYGSNSKGGKTLCRISGLYGPISQEVSN